MMTVNGLIAGHPIKGRLTPCAFFAVFLRFFLWRFADSDVKVDEDATSYLRSSLGGFRERSYHGARSCFDVLLC